jgi:uncharacterized protein Yka (UPF0111/DUF47 family)
MLPDGSADAFEIYHEISVEDDMTIGKAKIVGELAGASLLLPELVTEALAANARIKFSLSWLQTAEASAQGGGAALFVDLEPERGLVGLGDDPLYAAPTVARGAEGLLLPPAAAILTRIREDLGRMRAAIEAGVDAGILAAGEAAIVSDREQKIAQNLELDGEVLPDGLVSALSRPAQEKHDSLHGLVMDMHKAINIIAAGLSEEIVDGARVYRLGDEDKARVAAFMRGLNRTAPLKFDHPGLAANAMRDRTRLVIQDDIGTTDAHVLIAYVEGRRLSVTYSDIHRQRLEFFQRRLKRFSWTVVNRRADNLEEDMFYLATGSFEAPDLAALDGALEQLGASLVFLIDWNKARKSLSRLIPKQAAVSLLDWAADKEFGHRAYLEIGGDALVANLLETVSKATGAFYTSLQRALGEDGATQFLRETLRIANEELQKNRAVPAVHDLLRAELLTRVASISDRILDIAIDHAALVLDLGNLVRGKLLDGQAAGREFAERAAKWEALADRQVTNIRDLCGDGRERAWRVIASAADDAADDFEDIAFRLQFLPKEVPAEVRADLLRLAEHAVTAIKHYVRLLCALRNLRRGAPRQEMREFLDCVEKLHDEEHATDKAERDVFATLMGVEVPARTLNLVTAIASGLERTGDTLLHVGRLVSDHAMGEWFAA